MQEAAGEPVDSVFTVVHAAGGTLGGVRGQAEVRLFERSWPDAIEVSVVDEDEGALVDAAVAALGDDQPTLTFVHLAGPDRAGHDTADFMGRRT